MNLDKKIEEAQRLNDLVHEIPKYNTISELKEFREYVKNLDMSEKDKEVLYPFIDGRIRYLHG